MRRLESVVMGKMNRTNEWLSGQNTEIRETRLQRILRKNGKVLKFQSSSSDSFEDTKQMLKKILQFSSNFRLSNFDIE